MAGLKYGLAILLSMWCCGTVAPANAVNKTVNMKLVIAINVPMPCTVSGATIEFGNVQIQQIDGSNFTQPVDYGLNCSGRLSDYLKLQIQGTAVTINGESLLQTSVSGLGIRLQTKAGKSLVPIGSTDWMNFQYTGGSGPELEAVLVKNSGETLPAGEFSAAATLVVDYQ